MRRVTYSEALRAYLFIARGMREVGGCFLFLTDGIVEITLSIESAFASLG